MSSLQGQKPGPIPSENTPLLSTTPTTSSKKQWFSPLHRVMATSFCISLAFSFTQTAIIYAFRVMTCDEYYKHNLYGGPVGHDRCAIPKIEANTAANVAILTSTTTFFTIINIFVVGWTIRRYGVKATMIQQTAWAAARNLCQIYAQTIGGEFGIRMIEITQAFNILGGGGGAALAGNAYIAALVNADDRTGAFGILSGVGMLGSCLGFVGGGIAYRYIGPLIPFTTAFLLFCFATLFGMIFLPYIAPTQPSTTEPEKKKGFLEPLRVFVPRKKSVNGRQKWDFNLFLLGLGAFASVFATGYVSMGLQLIGTNVFGFEPMKSGFMLSFNLLVKSFFLSICFPRIISTGRRLVSHRSDVPIKPATEDHPEDPRQAEEDLPTGAPSQHVIAQTPTDIKHGSTFDLHYLQWSIFLDGCLACLCSCSTQGYHLFIAAGILPFASGTGAAAKGVTLDFCEVGLRADALSAITLVEMLAYICTTGLFGYVFSWLSAVQKPMLLFAANGAVAFIAFLILLPIRMPRKGEELLS